MANHPLDPEAWHVLVRLERWQAETTELLGLLDTREPRSEAETERVRELFASLKARLRAEREMARKVRQIESLTSSERDYYYPAVRAAVEALRAKGTSRPGPRWSADLRKAHAVFTTTAARLRSHPDG